MVLPRAGCDRVSWRALDRANARQDRQNESRREPPNGSRCVIGRPAIDDIHDTATKSKSDTEKIVYARCIKNATRARPSHCDLRNFLKIAQRAAPKSLRRRHGFAHGQYARQPTNDGDAKKRPKSLAIAQAAMIAEVADRMPAAISPSRRHAPRPIRSPVDEANLSAWGSSIGCVSCSGKRPG